MREKQKINRFNCIAPGGEKPWTAHLSSRCREKTGAWLRAVSRSGLQIYLEENLFSLTGPNAAEARGWWPWNFKKQSQDRNLGDFRVRPSATVICRSATANLKHHQSSFAYFIQKDVGKIDVGEVLVWYTSCPWPAATTGFTASSDYSSEWLQKIISRSIYSCPNYIINASLSTLCDPKCFLRQDDFSLC